MWMRHHQSGQIGDHVVRVVEEGHRLDLVQMEVVVLVQVHKVVILRLVQSMDDGQIGDHVVRVVEEGHRLDLVLIHHLQMAE
jgi:predicted Ser/Thr protein kinase